MSSDPNWSKVEEFSYDRWFSPGRDRRLEGFLRRRGPVPDPEARNEPRWVHVVETDDGQQIAVREYERLIPRLLTIGIGTRVSIEALNRVRWNDGREGAWRWNLEIQKSPFPSRDEVGRRTGGSTNDDEQREHLSQHDGEGEGVHERDDDADSEYPF